MRTGERASFRDRMFAGLQHVLPQHLLSRVIHWLARRSAGPIHRAAIRVFIKLFGVDMAAAAQADASAYPTFNAFFTRALKPGVRPLAGPDGTTISPVDGRISQLGRIHAGQLYQAKGHQYQLAELLGDVGAGTGFADGRFATIYLAPHNYHRIHMPLDGCLRAMHFRPGKLFSVNAATARTVPGLFARNERVACLFDGPRGPFAMVLVGALFVGSIETVWAGEVTPGGGRKPQSWHYPADGPGCIRLARGAEMGRFNMGSTVILVETGNGPGWLAQLQPGTALRRGQALSEAQ